MLMSVVDFKSLHWQNQNAVIEPILMAVLSELTEPTDNRKVMLEVASRIGWLDRNLDYLPGAGKTVGNVLRRFARFRPGLAEHDGEEFTFVGKTMRRWMWRPQPKPSEAPYDPFA